MPNARRTPESRPTETRHISMGDLISAIYDLAMQQLHDPELAAVATDATITDLFSRSNERKQALQALHIESAR